MEAFENLTKRLIINLNDASMDYMFTGALAASYYGNARTTTDVDLVVAATKKVDRQKLIQALKSAGLRTEEKRIEDALKSNYRIARFEDTKSPLTVDIIFSDEKKLRKTTGTALGLTTYYQHPEDLILAKLRMIKVTVPSERALKDVEDVKAVLMFTDVNVEALEKRTKKDNTLYVLRKIMTENAQASGD